MGRDVNICQRCDGTGHNGNCDACGGSGFIDRVRPTLPKRVVNCISDPSPAITQKSKLRHPALLMDGEALFGLYQHQLIFPSDNAAYKSAAIREQIRSIVSRHPTVSLIRWFAPSLCKLVLVSGVELVEDFSRAALLADSERVITAMAPEQPKRPRFTIPHVSQGGPPPGKAKKRKKRKPEVVVLVPLPKPHVTIMALKKKLRPKETERPYAPKSFAAPLVRTESSIEIAFDAAKAERVSDAMDGSKHWSGFRDIGSGQYGSHPAFDPSDDSD